MAFPFGRSLSRRLAGDFTSLECSFALDCRYTLHFLLESLHEQRATLNQGRLAAERLNEPDQLCQMGAGHYVDVESLLGPVSLENADDRGENLDNNRLFEVERLRKAVL